jgi:hypothetical protein
MSISKLSEALLSSKSTSQPSGWKARTPMALRTPVWSRHAVEGALKAVLKEFEKFEKFNLIKYIVC